MALPVFLVPSRHGGWTLVENALLLDRFLTDAGGVDVDLSYDFEDDTIGQVPAGWSLLYQTAVGGASVQDAAGDQVFEFTPGVGEDCGYINDDSGDLGDVIVSGSFTRSASASDVGVWIRHSGAADTAEVNGYFLRLYDAGSRIYSVVDGVGTSIDNDATVPAAGTEYNFRFEANGTTIRAWWGSGAWPGTWTLSVTDSDVAFGKVVLKSTNTGRFDDISITGTNTESLSYDFEDDTIDQPADGWSFLYEGIPGGSALVKAGQHLDINPNGATHYAVNCDDITSPMSDVVVTGQFRRDVSSAQARIHVRHTGDAEKDGYMINITGTEIYIQDMVDDALNVTVDSASGLTFTAGTWYNFRIQAVGTTIRAWAGTGDWPGTWQASGTSGTHASGGVVLEAAYSCSYDDIVITHIAEQAGLTSPRTCEPGPGTLTVIDTDVNAPFWYILNENLRADDGPQSANEMWIYENQTRARAAGLAAHFGSVAIAAGGGTYGPYFGFSSGAHNSGTDHKASFYLRGGVGDYDMFVYADGAAVPIDENQPVATRNYLSVLRNVGAFFIRDGKLMWVDHNDDLDPVELGIHNHSGVITNFDSVSLAQLSNYNAAWGGDFTEVLVSEASPVTATYYDLDRASDTIDISVDITRPDPITSLNAILIYAGVDNILQLGALAANATVNLYDVVNSQGLATSPNKLPAGSTGTMRMTIDNDRLARVFVDGVEVFEVTIPENTFQEITRVRPLHSGAGEDQANLIANAHPALGIATSRVVAPQTADTQKMEQSAIVELKNLTPPSTSNTFKLALKKAGTTYLYLFMDSTGAIGLYNYNAGVDGLILSGGAGTVSAGDDLVLVVDGVACEVFVNGTSVGSGNHETYITGRTLETTQLANDAKIETITCFPRDVTSLLPSELV